MPGPCRWAGQPIDMIVFDGLEGSGDINVVFLEIKTGKSQRNKHQRRVKAAVDAGRVQFAEYRPDRQWTVVAVEASGPEPAGQTPSATALAGHGSMTPFSAG
jgi:predicted Holliday junction resolvase-like endonuclease